MSRALLVIVTIIGLLGAAGPARGQSFEVSGLAGYTPSADLANKAPELAGTGIRGGFTWGLQGGWLLTPSWSVEALWTQQSSAQTIDTGSGSAELYTMTVGQLHGDVVYHLRSADARLRPFVFGGLGTTFFRADDLGSDTKFSFGLGGGVKYFGWNALGVRAHVRYKPTLLNDEDAADFCDPFGFCQGTLQQIEFAGGVVVRF